MMRDLPIWVPRLPFSILTINEPGNLSALHDASSRRGIAGAYDVALITHNRTSLNSELVPPEIALGHGGDPGHTTTRSQEYPGGYHRRPTGP
jgi:hypothetical protein